MLSLKEKYPTSHHAPRENCKHCKGTGERTVNGMLMACICIFVDHEHCDFVAKSLSDTAKKMRAEMLG